MTPPREDPHYGRMEVDDVLSAEEIGDESDGSPQWPSIIRFATAILALAIAASFGWLIGHGTPVTVAQTRVYLAIESLSAGASLGDPVATPSIDGHLFLEHAPVGTVVDLVTWGDQTTKISSTASPSQVTVTTHADCRAIARSVNDTGPKVAFPAMSAQLVAVDGTRTSVTVTALGTARWENVYHACVDPNLQIAEGTAVLACSVSAGAAPGGGAIVQGLVATTPGAAVSVSASYGTGGQGWAGLAADGKFVFALDPGQAVKAIPVTVQVSVTKGDATGYCSTAFTP